MLIGYARVSTQDQNLEMQNDALTKANCDRIYFEKSSAAAHRPEMEKMKDALRKGDTLIVWKMDRLARSLKDLVTWMEYFRSKKIGFVSLQENIDTSSPAGKLTFHLFAAMAEFERDLIKERTNAGLKAARARGRQGGRPRKLADKDIARLKELYKEGSMTINELCSQYHINRTSLYRYLKVK